MQQHEFIWMAKNLKTTSIVQDQIGKTTIVLRPQIQLVHNSKRKNEMKIVFIEDQSMFLIPSRRELETIYRLHLSHSDLQHILRNYCDQNLKRQ